MGGRSSAGSVPIDIPSASYGDDLGSSLKADENGVTVAVQTPMSSVDDASSRLAVPAPFSPSFDEFPPPCSQLLVAQQATSHTTSNAATLRRAAERLLDLDLTILEPAIEAHGRRPP